ncbi:MAG: EAL domain-containing protein [Terracidiphilus sp.]|nr:EAL domain-containing protein [Terracidiphilus sp.]
MDCIKYARAFLFPLIVSASLCAQEYSFRTFANTDGLNNLAIRTIYQDRVGFLWVSTENGIYRYDGERFEAFGPAQGMPANSGVAFGDAPDGSLLVGGVIGLYRMHGNRFERIPAAFKTINWAQGIQADGRGHTYLGTDLGLVVLSSQPGQDSFSMHTVARPPRASEPAAYGILMDGETVWYGCGLELCHIDQGQTEVLGRERGLPPHQVTTIRKDSAGSLWVRVRNDGVYVLPAGQARFRRPDFPTQGKGAVGIPATDADGQILLPSPDGLLIHSERGWQKIDSSAGVKGVVYSAFEDRQHSLWIGLAGRGLVQLRGYGEWEIYSTTSGLPCDLVYEILPQPGGVLWLGTEDGLARGQRLPSGIRWRKVPGLGGSPVHAVRPGPGGDLWIGTETSGVAQLNVRTGAVRWFGEAQGLFGKAAYTVRFDRDQRLWAATEAGLFVARPPYARFARVGELPASRFWAIAEGTDGTFWAGGTDGLYAFTGGQWRNFKPADGLSNREVLSLGAGANGMMWVGYRFGGGIDRVHLRENDLVIEKGVQRPGTDGLVYFFDFDALGRLWVGTENGVDVWDGSRWSHYDMDDGLVWNDCNLNGFAAEPDGTVWIGTSVGLSRFKPRPHLAPALPLRLVFTRLLMGRKDVSSEVNPSLDLHSNALIARFSALNASRQNGVLFRYRLEGANRNWTETALRELQFAELAPGAYRLQVEAQDSDQLWRTDRAEFAFTILTPWYRTWWFFTLCGLIPVVVVAAVVRSRIAEWQRRERELQRLMAAQDEIRSLAFFDPLTGLPNRRRLFDRLSRELATTKRNGHLRALLFIDLDDFKTLNDTLGHQTGDLLLQEVAQRLTASVRAADTVARLGGDEFVIMLDDLSELPTAAAAQAETIAEKIRDVVCQPYRLDGHERLSACSIGITVFGDQRESVHDILQQADIAMYQAKAAGRNTVRFFAPALQVAANARAALEQDLRSAIKSGQFLLYFQPQLDCGVVVGAEALVRWNHPERGILAPGEFIPMAEETGLILPLGDWVLDAVCRQIAAWAGNKATASITIAANISARQVQQPDFVDRVLAALDRAGCNPENLKLELTESMLVDNIDDIIAKMTALNLHGLTFSLDDFGTGYASLSYLKRLPLEQLKIDRSFVRDILTDASSGAIAQAVISLSKTMGLSVMAEGVETDEQRVLLARLGCLAYQGFLFSRPVPLGEFELLLPAWMGSDLFAPQ